MWTQPLLPCRPTTSMWCKSPPTRTGGCATAHSATRQAIWSACSKSAEAMCSPGRQPPPGLSAPVKDNPPMATTTAAPGHTPTADSHADIRVPGARENNLQGIDVEIPKRRLSVFTGVSSSGKTSLVFHTIAAESRRMIDETYSAFIQGFMPSRPRPDVDLLAGLTPAIIVDQERMGANPRSTVGTATDVYTMLRILFSRVGTPHIGSAQAFAFNVASISGAGAVTMTKGGEQVKERREFSVVGGICPRCEGRGEVSDFDTTALFDENKSINDGALTIPNYSVDGWYGRIFRGCGFFDPD